MADDWQVGDLALCVRGGDDTVKGRIYHVDSLKVIPAVGLVLRFSELMHLENHRQWWSLATRFRKIRPHEADEQDRETIALLTGKREPA